jgi:hypothetical protein
VQNLADRVRDISVESRKLMNQVYLEISRSTCLLGQTSRLALSKLDESVRVVKEQCGGRLRIRESSAGEILHELTKVISLCGSSYFSFIHANL